MAFDGRHIRFWSRSLFGESTGQENDFKLIPTVKVDTRHRRGPIW